MHMAAENHRTDSDRCTSTASTVSGIYRSILPSPAPVCMFYFAHPFGGIATPSSTSYTVDPYADMPPTHQKPICHTQNVQKNWCNQQCTQTEQHLSEYVPWPQQTWQCENILSPLVYALQQQIGQNISDFEAVLRAIREAWHPLPNSCEAQYLHNYYSFIQRQKQLNERNFHFISNWQEENPSQYNSNNGENLMEKTKSFAETTTMSTKYPKAAASAATMKQANVTMDGRGVAHSRYNRPHVGLLRRRHSLPEIIMRKHTLATQKHTLEGLTTSRLPAAVPTAPSPPTCERIPNSFLSSSRNRTQTTSPPLSSSTTTTASSSSTIALGTAFSTTGSDSNLSRMYSSNGSMRRQLLRRLWHKEYSRFDRTGSLSPPMQRSQRSRRGLRPLDSSPEVCLECQKLEETQFNRSVPEMTLKRINYNSASLLPKSNGATTALKRKSYSIETETINTSNDHHMLLSSSSDSNYTNTFDEAARVDDTNQTTSSELDIAEAVNMLNEMNGNFAPSTTDANENEIVHTQDENSFLIEIEGDQINITTTATTGSTTTSESSPLVDGTSFKASTAIQTSSLKSINSGPSPTDNRRQVVDDTNNNNSVDNCAVACTQLDNDYTPNTDTLKSKQNNGVEMKSDLIIMPPAGSTSITSTNTTDTTSNTSFEQNAIDTFLSQILVDSLNNIIVVKGKVNQASSQPNAHGESIVELSTSETQTDTPVAGEYYINEQVSENTLLPLPLCNPQQIYFPHYLSAETISEYSAKYSNESNVAIELLPTNLVISVISGSSYPMDGGEMIVHRVMEMHRTESMEVQPSSGSLNDDDAEMRATNDSDNDNEDDNESLVDSLDDPNAMVDVNDVDFVNETTPKPIEKSQAFYVPMIDSEKSEENSSQQQLNENPDNALTISVANAMPERLREKLEKRQMEMSQRKEAEMKRKQKKIQKLIDQYESKTDNVNGKMDRFDSIERTANQPTPLKKSEGASKSIPLKKNNKLLRSEIGLLESYTVDAQGNLQFKEQKSGMSKKVSTKSGPVVKHVAIKKTIATKSTISKKPREVSVSVASKNMTGKRSHEPSKLHTTAPRNRVARHNDVQKMTLLHQSSPSDMITPDIDCGPQRMYQKTEIHEGTKRIEILEIVECLNSSPDQSFPSHTTTSTSSSSSSTSQQQRSFACGKQSSKIPVPVPIKINKSNIQHSVKTQLRDMTNYRHNKFDGSGKNFNKSLHAISNNSKVDQIIADLLIEALNHSTDIGIEFVKTPQYCTSQSVIKLNNSKRMNLTTRRSSGGAIGGGGCGGKRSAHNSGKYQQVFDAIPEEKSSSLSVDSPASDERLSSSNATTGGITITSTECTGSNNSKRSTTGSSNAYTDVKIELQSAEVKIRQSNKTKNPEKVASGKAAIESDQDKSETWFGCFGRTHVDSPVDAILLDEGNQYSSPVFKLKSTHGESQTIQSNASNTETNSSMVTSIPSEAVIPQTTSTNSDNILPLIDETFETSVTGIRADDSMSTKPYRKNAKCSMQNLFQENCAECNVIENELQMGEKLHDDKIDYENEHSQVVDDSNNNNHVLGQIDEINKDKGHAELVKPQRRSENNENVWQVSNIEKYDTFGKLNLSPITILSAQENTTNTTTALSNGCSLKSGIDSTSFIILHDDSSNPTIFFPNITGSSDASTNRNGFQNSKNDSTDNKYNRLCHDCCFCNPTLHQHTAGNSPKKCNYCSSRHQSSHHTTPANSNRYKKQQQRHDNDVDTSARSSTAPTERIYESKFRSNHTHIQTRSKESPDTVSTKCTKKSNRHIRKTISNGNNDDDHLNGNADRFVPSDQNKMRTNEEGKMADSKELNNDKNGKKSTIPKLPPYNEWSLNSFETTTSPSCSSVSTSSSSHSRRRQDSKSVPNLPTAERWPNASNPNNATKSRTNSRYQEFYSNDGVDGKTSTTIAMPSESNAKQKAKAAGWTVTLAGTYHDDMAPDVQMHLCFPKRSSSQTSKSDKSTTQAQRAVGYSKQEKQRPDNGNYADDDERNYDERDLMDSDDRNQQAAILPPPQVSQPIKLNPKRSLSKNFHTSDYQQQQQQHQHSQLAPHRKYYDSNGNANHLYNRSSKEILNLPDVNQPRMSNTNRIIAKQTAKKTIKRSEYSVAVASATTTRTISNFHNGKRAMSFQALNANAAYHQRFHNVNRNPYRDHSIELGHLTQRFSTPSPQPSSSYYNGYSPCGNANDANEMTLSILGNAIAPERKPPVPTMSERDLTRRHNSTCFTRNRSIFP